MSSARAEGLEPSLVLIEVAGGSSTAACLDVLTGFGAACLALLRAEREDLVQAYPDVRFEVLAAPVPLRRQRAVELAETELVVLVEDTTLPGPSLLAGLQRAFAFEACVAASGPVAIARELGARQQALACTEYGRYHYSNLFSRGGPEPREVQRLPGNLLAYRRSAVLEALEKTDGGLQESWINARLAAAGGLLLMAPELAQTYAGGDAYGARLSTRFQHGWIYAGTLAEDKGLLGRLVQAAKSLLLPVVLSLRALSHLGAMPELDRKLPVAAWICVLELFWSAGELVGSLLGKPQDLGAWR